MKYLEPGRLEQNIEKIAQSDLIQNKVFGSSYCVMQGEKTVYQKCFGRVSVGEAAAVTEETLFRLASMTKPITAVATLILAERKQLALEAAVSDYLPEFADIHVITVDGQNLGIPRRQPVIRDLLTHTSGIGSENLKMEKRTAADMSSLEAFIDFSVRSGLDFEPGSRQLYSGVAAFDVLTKIIELVSGMDYLAFLQKEILEPCGMHDTTFIPSEEQWGRMIDMHTRAEGRNAVHPMKKGCVFGEFPCTHYLGGAGLVSTLGDYRKFAQMLLNKGRVNVHRLLSEETLQLMRTPWVSKDIMPGAEQWGLGVRVITDEAYGSLPVGSFGWSGAYGSHFWVDPENEIVAVYMKNSMVDGGAGNHSARDLEKAVYSALVNE